MRQHGFGLVELCISLFLSTFIIIVLVTHLVRTRHQYQRIESDIDEAMELQWVSNLMRHSIRSAGYTPCARLDRLVMNQNVMPLEVKENPQVKITVRRMDSNSVRVDARPQPNVLIVKSYPYQMSRPLLVADCYHAEVNALEAIKSTKSGIKLILKDPLYYTYQDPMYVGEWVVESFFIKHSQLYYKNARVDGLKKHIHDFDAKIFFKQNKQLIQMQLKLDDGRIWQLNTMVRAQ